MLILWNQNLRQKVAHTFYLVYLSAGIVMFVNIDAIIVSVYLGDLTFFLKQLHRSIKLSLSFYFSFSKYWIDTEIVFWFSGSRSINHDTDVESCVIWAKSRTIRIRYTGEKLRRLQFQNYTTSYDVIRAICYMGMNRISPWFALTALELSISSWCFIVN